MYGAADPNGGFGGVRRSRGLEPGNDGIDGEVDSNDVPLVGVSDIAVRHGFIRKVYSIVAVQLCLTTAIAGGILKLGRDWIPMHPTLVMTLMFFSLAGSIGTMCVFQCFPATMRRTPTNYLLLLFFTLCEALMVGFICLTYTLDSVLIAVGVTAFIVIALTLFACQTKVDFTGMGPYLFAGSICLMLFGFLFMVGAMLGLGGTQAFQTVHIVYSCIGAMLFSCYIVFHTQLIIGGKHQFQFTIDDYAIAAINLYIDIIQLFLYVLRLLGKRR